MQKTFDFYRSTNSRLAASIDQEDQYERYLKRIETIVAKKPQLDLSNSHYMSFLGRCKEVARNHRSQQALQQVSSENQILLEKIVNAKKRKYEKQQDRYMLAMHEKRFRELEKINEENKRIAVRIIKQGSLLRLRSGDQMGARESPRRVCEKTFYESRVKDRKLPKLVEIRS